jgi:NAD-dependent DNA ligase
MSSTAEIVGLLREAAQAYYSGKPMMDNDTYDGIVERLRELDPTNSYLTERGPSDTLLTRSQVTQYL